MNINSNSSNWIEIQTRTIEDKLVEKQKRIAELLGYDISLSFIFNESKNIALLKSKYNKYENALQLSTPDIIFVNKGNYSMLNKLIESKTLIENNENNDNRTLLKGIKSEVYIPIFEYCDSKEMPTNEIGCLYLGSITHNKNFSTSEYNTSLSDIVSDISKLYALVLADFRNSVREVNLICTMMEMLSHNEVYLPSHSYNVANWCIEIGQALGYSPKTLHTLTYSGLLHDVGKCMIDSNILNKPSSLTEDEYEIVKKHPIYSYKILKNIFENSSLLDEIPLFIKYHHERYDGQGYPEGLKGKEVPLESYVVGISDAVDAMLSQRPYKRAFPLKEVIRELYRNKGKQFHPQLVEIMVEKLSKAQKQNGEKLLSSINMGSLIINNNGKMRIIEGTFIDMKRYYVFKPADEILTKGIDLSKVTNVEIAIKDLNNLNYYKVKLEDFINNIFYISDIKPIPSENTFSLYWNLNGTLYNSVGIVPIEIVRIGGNSLDFYTHNIQKIGFILNKTLIVKILFDDGDVDITGHIVKNYNFGPYRYFELRYTNIPDSKRDYIYRQLFRKQIELRKTIAECK